MCIPNSSPLPIAAFVPPARPEPVEGPAPALLAKIHVLQELELDELENSRPLGSKGCLQKMRGGWAQEAGLSVTDH